MPALLGVAQRWLSNTFRPTPDLTAPIRYRFDISEPVPLRQDVLVSHDGFQREPVTDRAADVTFRCTTGDYLLFVYGRLPLDRAVDTGRLEEELRRYADRPLKIGSFSAASNVTGIVTDTDAISALLHRYGALSFWDFAAAAPYVEIEMSHVPRKSN